jgi:hypothetical protein
MATIKEKLDAFFKPSLKLIDRGGGIMWANCNESKKITRMWRGTPWILVKEYDDLLRFVSKFGLSIEVETPIKQKPPKKKV